MHARIGIRTVPRVVVEIGPALSLGAGLAALLRGACRYTRRVAISNRRLIDIENERVRSRRKDYAEGRSQKTMTLSAEEFIRRFFLHVPPKGFGRIRHCCFLANRHRNEKLARCRELIRAPEDRQPASGAEAGAPSDIFADLDQLVFLDKSSAKTNMTRLYGRAPVGQRCYFSAPHGHWHTTTLLSALRCAGVIEDASIVFDGPTDAIVFRGYIQQCLAPSLTHGDIVAMDNLSSHKVVGVREAIESVGASVQFLPPYSPDLNPIEKMWSKIKTRLRRVTARTVEGLIRAVGDAFWAVGADECRAYFGSCGYDTLDC